MTGAAVVAVCTAAGGSAGADGSGSGRTGADGCMEMVGGGVPADTASGGSEVIAAGAGEVIGAIAVLGTEATAVVCGAAGRRSH